MLKSKLEAVIVNNTILLRKKAKKTQRDVAEKLGVSAGYIGQVESANSPSMYTYNHLNELAKFFECSLKDFMPDEPL